MGTMPVAIERSGQDILITWSDSTTRRYSPGNLRKNCPCALCKEKRGHEPQPQAAAKFLPVISLAETMPLEITGMKPIGNYAYNIQFSDGHSSGIFEFQSLYELGELASK